MTVHHDVLNRMMVEIVYGWEWGDPRSQVPQDEEHHTQWDRLVEQIAEIRREGYEVQIPNE